jgi:hypothetical protein
LANCRFDLQRTDELETTESPENKAIQAGATINSRPC